MQKLKGQRRVAAGMGVWFIGWDMNAAFSVADALGIDRMAVAEFLPEVETVAMAKMNEQSSSDES